MSQTALPIKEGASFRYGDRTLVLVSRLTNDRLNIVDQKTNELFVVYLSDSEHPEMADIAWFLSEWFNERIKFGAAIEEDNGSARYLELDTQACVSRNARSMWKMLWAKAAIEAGAVTTPDPLQDWIDAAPIPKIPGWDPDVAYSGSTPNWRYAPKLSALMKTRPRSRTLSRAMATYHVHGDLIGAFMPNAGRKYGVSQLPRKVDRLVVRAVELYYDEDPDKRLVNKEDAAALVKRWWDILKARGELGIGEEAPVFETIRNRINREETYANYAKRHGKARADKKFTPSGEPIEVSRPFERVYMDGTVFRHAVLFNENYTVPSAKMKGVYAMDAFALYVFKPSIFCGPFRPEMAIQAALNVMCPPQMMEDEIREDPAGAQIFGIPSMFMYDNEKAMLPPRLVPGMSIISTVQLAAAYHHDAKSELESFFDFPKARVDKFKGKIYGPKTDRDLRVNPLKEANMTRAQYADELEQARLEWNCTAKKCLNGKSPNEVMLEYIASRGAHHANPNVIRREFAETPEGENILTDDGLVYENVRYRWNRDGTQEITDNNYYKTSFSKRLKNNIKVFVSIRVWSGNRDHIEILDSFTGRYHRFYSVDPGYTGGLSFWEHNEYRKMLGNDGRGPKVDKTRILAKSKRKALRAHDSELDSMGFKSRATPTGLLECEERRQKEIESADLPFAETASPNPIPINITSQNRSDIPKPPPQPRNGDEGASAVGVARKQGGKKKQGPKRSDDFGNASTAHLTREQFAQDTASGEDAKATQDPTERSKTGPDREVGQAEGPTPTAALKELATNSKRKWSRKAKGQD